MRKILLILSMLIVCAASADAQYVARFKSRLAERSASGARVDVAEDDSAADAVRQSDMRYRPLSVKGYRVVIFFDNGQYASDKARAIKSSFEHKYPHVNAYLVYESPYFKVSVGDCLSMEEAVILMNEIGGDFPTAFPKNEEISLTELTDVRSRRDTTAEQAEEQAAAR